MCFFLVSRCFFPSDQEQQKTKKKQTPSHDTNKKTKRAPKSTLCFFCLSNFLFFFFSRFLPGPASSPLVQLMILWVPSYAHTHTHTRHMHARTYTDRHVKDPKQKNKKQKQKKNKAKKQNPSRSRDNSPFKNSLSIPFPPAPQKTGRGKCQENRTTFIRS
jgi:ABC-type nickel/cobalt efflux system permease component RcnA